VTRGWDKTKSWSFPLPGRRKTMSRLAAGNGVKAILDTLEVYGITINTIRKIPALGSNYLQESLNNTPALLIATDDSDRDQRGEYGEYWKTVTVYVITIIEKINDDDKDTIDKILDAICELFSSENYSFNYNYQGDSVKEYSPEKGSKTHLVGLSVIEYCSKTGQ
jgi:hypothetical protein